MKKSIGAWAFIIGLVVAALIALVGASATPTWALVLLAVLGIVVGFMNVTEKEVVPFLVASIAWLLAFQSLSAVVAGIPLVGAEISAFFALITVFIAPAAAIVAFKALFAAGKN